MKLKIEITADTRANLEAVLVEALDDISRLSSALHWHNEVGGWTGSYTANITGSQVASYAITSAGKLRPARFRSVKDAINAADKICRRSSNSSRALSNIAIVKLNVSGRVIGTIVWSAPPGSHLGPVWSSPTTN